MTMFVSKVWGFDNPCGPLIFGMPGWRDRATGLLKPGDRVVLVGTKGEETALGDRNRVLGMMEPSTIHVATSDFPILNPNDRRLYKEDGSFRWPYGLLNRHAWEFEPGLFLEDVAPRPGNPFGSATAAGIVTLTVQEEAKVLAHPHYQVPLLKSVATDRKLYGNAASKRRGAPPPSEGIRRGVMHMRDAAASVYWFRLISEGKIVGHKIGWAFEWKQRLRQFNSISLNPLGGLRYKVNRTQEFDTARLAFRVEQELLRAFDSQRHPANREVLRGPTTEQIEAVWMTHVTSAMLGRTVRPLSSALPPHNS